MFSLQQIINNNKLFRFQICDKSLENYFLEKIYSEYESTMDEFKDKIKNLEDDLEEAREFSKKNAKEIEANWSAKYQKLSDEKNEEITRHLKKSIDLIDENELLENQLEKLYLLIEEKNLQINSLEENVFEYQNEVKKIQLDLQSVDIIGYQYKRNKTKEIAVDTCDFIGKYKWPGFHNITDDYKICWLKCVWCTPLR